MTEFRSKLLLWTRITLKLHSRDSEQYSGDWRQLEDKIATIFQMIRHDQLFFTTLVNFSKVLIKNAICVFRCIKISLSYHRFSSTKLKHVTLHWLVTRSPFNNTNIASSSLVCDSHYFSLYSSSSCCVFCVYLFRHGNDTPQKITTKMVSAAPARMSNDTLYFPAF